MAAHGGPRPTGASTTSWQEAANRLRRAQVLECESIEVQLSDEGQVVASSEPNAKWLPGNVLAVQRATAGAYDNLAAAAQAMLERQDLIKDLRLVLGLLPENVEPAQEQLEAALVRAEIDALAYADIRHRWAGTTSLLLDRLRPLLALLETSTEGLEAAATDLEQLSQWLSRNVDQWPHEELLATTRRSRDDRAMGHAAWKQLGTVAELPAWNAALETLGERYEAVTNIHVSEQSAAHLDAAKPFLSAFARHVARATENPDLFLRLEETTRAFSLPAEWASRWWQVPFQSVIDALAVLYADQREGLAALIQLLSSASSTDELLERFKRDDVQIAPDPYETASLNVQELDATLSRVHDLHCAWREMNDVKETPPAPSAAEIGASGYLTRWSAGELLERALAMIEDPQFLAACAGSESVDGLRDHLGVGEAAFEAHRAERQKKRADDARKRRTFEVAGKPFEVGAASYQGLLDRLNKLGAPDGPSASKDMFSPLANAQPSGRSGGGGTGSPGKTSHLRTSAELIELVGVAGEIQAYRFLRAEFGERVVTRDAWVSELRLKVLPLLPGEEDRTSDGHGYDFRFRYRNKTWHVEVKATQGDATQFDLGMSEIEAASRFALEPKRPWRILRVSNALSDSPTVEWLPNPFEKEGFRKLYQLRQGGVLVSYRRKKDGDQL